MTLTNQEKKQLKRLAHHLKPVVMVGKNGVSESLLGSVDDALESHELIKMKFVDNKSEKHQLSDEIAAQTDSSLVGVVGNVAILFRENPRPELRKIDLN